MIALVFTGAWTEVIGCIESVAGLGVLAGVAGMLVCHKHGCYRLGRFRHGHFRLCRIHHPGVPSDGKITQEHIDSVS